MILGEGIKMSEFEKLLQKVKLENLRSYIIYGIYESGDTFENYEEKLEKSFREFYAVLESMYEKANRNDSRLHDAVIDFAMVHEDIYFEAGVLIGVQLIRNLEQEYDRHKNCDMEFIWNRAGGSCVTEEHENCHKVYATVTGEPVCSEVKGQGEADTP